MSLTAGDILQNRYRIVSPLGQGGMGAVYRAWDTRLNVPVALKEMTPQPGLDPETLTQLRQQFQQEATILARLDHPHLVRVTDFFQEGGNAYLVMNFVEGKSLADHIEQEGALPEAQVLEWGNQLLDALGYCHNQGVIHRDVKPQNVIIRPDGQALLVDFGLVKLWDPSDPRTRTAMRGMGTPEYAPPEQYDTQMGHTDPRSDIYSLGATLYHALTGQAPPTATMRIASQDAFRPPRALNQRISPAIEAAMLRAMELTVKNRFPTAQEMKAALGSGAPAPAHPAVVPKRQPTKVVPEVRPAASPRKPMPVWAWALGGLTVLALVVGLVVVTVGLAVMAGGMGGGSRLTPTSPPSPMATPTHTHAPPTRPPTRTPAATATRRPTTTPVSAPTSTPTRRPPTQTPIPASGYIPSLNARVTELRFFEGGFEPPPREQRVYGDRFARATSRYIYWELNLEHPAPGRHTDFVIRAVYYRADGSVFAEQTLDTDLAADWTRSWHWNGWGWDNPGNWPVGSYRVELYIAGKRVAIRSFKIYG